MRRRGRKAVAAGSLQVYSLRFVVWPHAAAWTDRARPRSQRVADGVI